MPSSPRPSGLPKKIPAWAWKWLHWRTGKKQPAPKPPTPSPPPPSPPLSLSMFDSVTVSEIPKTAMAVAGYVGGHWPTYNSLVKGWPHAKHLSIAIAASEDADCLDIEQGDASPDQAAAWIRRQKKRGIQKPVVYTSVSQAQGLIDLLAKAGITRSQYRLWTAHYTGHQHRCGPSCGFGFKSLADATQYDDKALGRNLDVSYCSPGFFP